MKIETGNSEQSEFRSADHESYCAFSQKYPDEYVPDWVVENEDKETCYYNSEQSFWYQTEEDYQNGMTNSRNCEETDVVLQTYKLDPFGDLMTLLIGEKAWVPIDDVAKLIGCSDMQITGYISEYEYSVRGEPGHLVPDGIRNIYPIASSGGIRLEAAIRCCEMNNVRPEVIDYLNYKVLPAVYAGRGLTDNLMKHVGYDSLAGGPKINIVRDYHKSYGAMLVFRYGTHTWLELLGLAMHTNCDPNHIAWIAGTRRILSFDALAMHNIRGGKHATTYVRSDVVGALVGGKSFEFATTFAWSRLLPEVLETRLPPADSSASVSLEVLRQILLPTATLDSFVYELGHRFPELRPRFDDLEAVAIPPGLARDIALAKGGFVGRMVAYLIADGGYFHGGSLAETPDQTLLRFRGLVPNGNGQVEARKIWEFLNCPYAYDDWIENKTWYHGKNDPVTEGMVDAAGHWCYDVRNYTTSLPVDFRIDV